MQNTTSVSYTHLDVYKRQEQKEIKYPLYSKDDFLNVTGVQTCALPIFLTLVFMNLNMGKNKGKKIS